jgi:hypothetical protein
LGADGKVQYYNYESATKVRELGTLYTKRCPHPTHGTVTHVYYAEHA